MDEHRCNLVPSYLQVDSNVLERPPQLFCHWNNSPCLGFHVIRPKPNDFRYSIHTVPQQLDDFARTQASVIRAMRKMGFGMPLPYGHEAVRSCFAEDTITHRVFTT
jgi:hypothetical protein